MNEEQKICTFYINEYLFGLEVARIQEIIRYQETTFVPLADETISGLINLRGEIVTVIDMRKLLGLSQQKAQESLINIVVKSEDCSVSLLVDDIGDVMDISSDNFEPPPENLTGGIRKILKQVCQLESAILLLLDIDKVLNLVQDEFMPITI